MRTFLKVGERAVLEAEMLGLGELRVVRVPRIIGLTARGLELEYLEPGVMSDPGWEQLGRDLAEMHRVRKPLFGWERDNFIGQLPQSNVQSDDWPTFWCERRIGAQLTNKLDSKSRRRIENLMRVAPEMLAVGNEERASLLHGDLWRGNAHALADGTAALIDPCVYYGHREADLAMTALFGGFSERFYRAYDEAWPLQSGHEQRRDMYQLYYMLVHVNLFGGSYVSGTMSLVQRLGF